MRQTWWLIPALLCPALLWGLAGAQGQRAVLDMRMDPGYTRLSSLEQGRVLRETRAYARLPVCPGGEVRDVAYGSFTRPTARQTAYLVMNCETSPRDADRQEFGRLVIYENGKIVWALKNIGDAIGNVGDLNGDRVDDLVFLTYYGPFVGQMGANASLVSVAGQRLKTFLDLNDVWFSSCLVGDSGDAVMANRVTVTPGIRPQFTVQEYKGTCSRERDPVFRLVRTLRL